MLKSSAKWGVKPKGQDAGRRQELKHRSGHNLVGVAGSVGDQELLGLRGRQ